MTAERHSPRWWALVVLHNAVIHPWLPLADVLGAYGGRRGHRLASVLYRAHDATFPQEAG